VNLWWYLARACGLVAWWLASGAVFSGLLLSIRVRRGSRPPPGLVDLHRFLGLLTVAFTASHVGAIVGDNFVHFGRTDVLVPFSSGWHPVAVAPGVLAMYVLVVVQFASWIRKWLGRTLWRLVNVLAYVLFGLVTAHALTAGTERRLPMTRWAAAAVCGVFVFLLLWRWRSSRATPPAGDNAPSGRPTPAPSDNPPPARADTALVTAARPVGRARSTGIAERLPVPSPPQLPGWIPPAERSARRRR
jgi:hypothetical protein